MFNNHWDSICFVLARSVSLGQWFVRNIGHMLSEYRINLKLLVKSETTDSNTAKVSIQNLKEREKKKSKYQNHLICFSNNKVIIHYQCVPSKQSTKHSQFLNVYSSSFAERSSAGVHITASSVKQFVAKRQIPILQCLLISMTWPLLFHHAVKFKKKVPLKEPQIT
jgi:hypothetical protein